MTALPRISFTVAGTPLPWARARRRGSRYFTAPEQAAYRERIAWAFQAAITQVPETWSLCARYAVRLVAEFPDHKRHDADNVAKGCLDALINVAYIDDSQVDDLRIVKRVGDDPRLDVEIAVIALAPAVTPKRARRRVA